MATLYYYFALLAHDGTSLDCFAAHVSTRGTQAREDIYWDHRLEAQHGIASSDLTLYALDNVPIEPVKDFAERVKKYLDEARWTPLELASRVHAQLGEPDQNLIQLAVKVSAPLEEQDDLGENFPSLLGFTDAHGEVKYLRYNASLKPRPCNVFQAVLGVNLRVVVKFVMRYGETAHRLLAEAGLAPRLLYYGAVWPPEPKVKGYEPRKMVVMEYFDGVHAQGFYEGAPMDESVRKTVRRALDLLQAHDMVHGDIRRANIVVRRGGDPGEVEAKLVDFDWAGPAGEARYPVELSPHVKWPEGARRDDLITPAHDEFMLNQL